MFRKLSAWFGRVKAERDASLAVFADAEHVAHGHLHEHVDGTVHRHAHDHAHPDHAHEHDPGVAHTHAPGEAEHSHESGGRPHTH